MQHFQMYLDKERLFLTSSPRPPTTPARVLGLHIPTHFRKAGAQHRMNQDEMSHDRCHVSFLPFSTAKLHASGTVGTSYMASLKEG